MTAMYEDTYDIARVEGTFECVKLTLECLFYIHKGETSCEAYYFFARISVTVFTRCTTASTSSECGLMGSRLERTIRR
jgi:hypothetical protein